MRPLQILHVVPTFYPATYFGGPIFSLLALCQALVRQGDVSIEVVTTDRSGPRRSDRIQSGYPDRMEPGFDVYRCPAGSPRLAAVVASRARHADVVHLTGVYSAPTWAALLAHRLLNKPLVWSPRGALQRWEGSRRVALKEAWDAACLRVIDRRRVVLHVTSRQELEESVAHIPVAARVIANGIDVPEALEARTWRPEGALRLLFMGRLDRKKGIENLLGAMTRLPTHVQLTLAGSGDARYQASLTELARRLDLGSRVTFAGEVRGPVKTAAFRDADLCVVPSHTENFGMVVVEALAHGVPVIASVGTPWEELDRRGCGLWRPNDPESLARAIEELAGRDLRELGASGRRWMQDEFDWASIAAKMGALYRELASGRRPGSDA